MNACMHASQAKKAFITGTHEKSNGIEHTLGARYKDPQIPGLTKSNRPQNAAPHVSSLFCIITVLMEWISPIN